MKKTLVVLCTVSLLSLAAHAGEGEGKKEGDKPKKPEWTAEQKAVWKEITEKYDTNKNGKLDKDERAKISAEDRERLNKAGLVKNKAEGHEGHEHKEGDKH